MDAKPEIRVCMDIGCHMHSVGIGLSTSAKFMETFELPHKSPDIEAFFKKIEHYESKYKLPVTIAMEGYNGHARPIDQQALKRGYRLLNVNNHKLAQFKKIFPGPAKTDAIDTEKMFEMCKMSEHLPFSKRTLEEVKKAPAVNERLKRLTRRRRALVDEKVAVVNRMQTDLRACSPGLLAMSKKADNKWFLHFLTSRSDIRQLAKMQKKSLLKIKGVGKTYVEQILAWQPTATFSDDVSYVGEMINSDAQRLMALDAEIAHYEQQIDEAITSSEMAQLLISIPGFGPICSAELAGEIGTLERFSHEASLALYLGMAVLDNSSGTYVGSRTWRHVNWHCKRAMMVAIARHIENCEESKRYYDKKRLEGKKHNQAIRSLGRHMTRVMWSMFTKGNPYRIKTELDNGAA